mgnify:FL=1
MVYDALADLGYAGTLETFVEGTAAGGRTIGSGVYRSTMPAFAQGLGGPLRADQVGDVVRFVLSSTGGEDGRASGPMAGPSAPATVAEGDPVVARGKVAYQANACLGCHDWPGRAGVTGPDLAGLASRRAQAAPDLDAGQFIRVSILAPSAHLAPDCPPGPCPDMMPRTYGDDLPQEDLDAIVAYLLTLE